MVNTDIMGPGFQSAYGLVLAIHLDARRGGFDNQIRTHGSDDYTSIARRFSRGSTMIPYAKFFARARVTRCTSP